MFRLEYIDLDDKKTVLLCKSEGAAIFYCLLAQARYRDSVEYAFKMPHMRIVGRESYPEIPIYPDILKIDLCGVGHVVQCFPCRPFASVFDFVNSLCSDNREYSISVNHECIGYNVSNATIEAKDVSWTLW